MNIDILLKQLRSAEILIQRVKDELTKIEYTGGYPYQKEDILTLGPEIFTDSSEDVICWKGRNYYSREYYKALTGIDSESSGLLASLISWISQQTSTEEFKLSKNALTSRWYAAIVGRYYHSDATPYEALKGLLRQLSDDV